MHHCQVQNGHDPAKLSSARHVKPSRADYLQHGLGIMPTPLWLSCFIQSFPSMHKFTACL